jgi:hypothetical protein
VPPNKIVGPADAAAVVARVLGRTFTVENLDDLRRHGGGPPSVAPRCWMLDDVLTWAADRLREERGHV